MRKLKHILGSVALVAATIVTATSASADVFVQIENGDPSQGQSSGFADASHIVGLPLFASFDYSGPIDFDIQSGPNTMGNFFDLADISNFSSNVTLANFANVVMSTPGPSDGTCSGSGETGCLATDILIIGQTAGGSVAVTHDDGASLYEDPYPTVVFENPNPTSAITDTGTLAAGTFYLFYAEDNGAPSVLEMDVNGQNFTPNSVPEPLTLSLFGAGLAGAAALRRRRKANKAA